VWNVPQTASTTRPCHLQRAAPTGDLAGPLAQLRRRRDYRQPARHHPASLRPGRHPLRPRQQLRPALRRRRAKLRTNLREDFSSLRDELIISTKAGWDMWPGPYGDLGSRKYLLASLDQSLKRSGLDYVDIFYHHHFDPTTPLEESLGALDSAVRQGKALYVGISSYSDERTAQAVDDPARTRHAVVDPPAVVLHVQPLDRGQTARRLDEQAWAASPSPRSVRASSPSATSTVFRPVRAPRRVRRSRATS
jgi:hypothetical protein